MWRKAWVMFCGGLAAIVLVSQGVWGEDSRRLKGKEILAIFSGAEAYGFHYEHSKKFKATFDEGGRLSIVYDYSGARPFRVRGNWSVKDDTWCRSIVVTGPGRYTPYKCQSLVEEGSAYYLVDLDGTKSSRFMKGDISK